MLLQDHRIARYGAALLGVDFWGCALDEENEVEAIRSHPGPFRTCARNPSALTPARLSRLMLGPAMIFAVIPAAALAGWLPNGTPVTQVNYCTDQWPITVVPDGAGGVIAAWASLDDERLMASRLTGAGTNPPGWPAEGTSLYLRSRGFLPLTVPDEKGGAFVVFNAMDCQAHCAVDPTELRAQHVTAGGSIADGWSPNGVSVGSGFGPDPSRTRDFGNTVSIPDARGGGNRHLV